MRGILVAALVAAAAAQTITSSTTTSTPEASTTPESYEVFGDACRSDGSEPFPVFFDPFTPGEQGPNTTTTFISAIGYIGVEDKMYVEVVFPNTTTPSDVSVYHSEEYILIGTCSEDSTVTNCSISACSFIVDYNASISYVYVEVTYGEAEDEVDRWYNVDDIIPATVYALPNGQGTHPGCYPFHGILDAYMSIYNESDLRSVGCRIQSCEADTCVSNWDIPGSLAGNITQVDCTNTSLDANKRYYTTFEMSGLNETAVATTYNEEMRKSFVRFFSMFGQNCEGFDYDAITAEAVDDTLK